MLSELDEQRVVRAIANAERGNRGEVRVHIERRCPKGDALTRAQHLYRALGMERTQNDTAVLLYIATKSRQAAIYAGAGVDAHVGGEFWRSVIDKVAKGFKEGRPGEGIRGALEEVGEVLREHLPGDDVAGNELPNEMTTPADVPEATE